MKCNYCKKNYKKLYSIKSKICFKCYYKNYYVENKLNFRIYARNRRLKLGHKETIRIYIWRNKHKSRFLKQHRKHALNYRLKYPLKYKAHILTQKIKIPKNKLCEMCNKNKATEKHIKNYLYPLKIKFVCLKCHRRISKKPLKTQIGV